ncbi:MAG TPA: MBOAT family O-acyltransferase [Patescibacteria group bacterium]|nr:MBOAT family O-acyltransferase [Patescibacteria group bacterium]
MLFSSWMFVGLFLPVTWCVYYALQARAGREVAFTWLFAASLFFYGWFKPVYLVIVLLSLAFNYAVGMTLSRRRMGRVKRRNLLIFGIAANLAALFYYKYTGLFFRTLNMAGGEYTVPDILLPLGISFFTFQKIAWLVDSYRRETEEPNFLHYGLFITFFPQLIAGPIVHHRDIIPQFMKRDAGRVQWNMVAAGFSLFIIGLFKKVCMADNMGEIADPIFAAVARGAAPDFFESWLGSVAYSLQIYFDFSGYSEMAIGIAAMFGIQLPLNFYAPYKSASITEFWRRWHITLSRFLRDYLYIPLGGNRRGSLRRYTNLLLTMLLGGLWHGANWTFLVWGGLHGIFLGIHHAWEKTGITLPRGLARAITLVAVICAWVFFRADSMETAQSMLRGMANMNGIALRNPSGGLGTALSHLGLNVAQTGSKLLQLSDRWLLFWAVFAVALFGPTAHDLMGRRLALDITGAAKGDKPSRYTWQPGFAWGAAVAVMGTVALLFLTRVNAFIYFQF